MTSNELNEIKKMSKVVADTGDFAQIDQYKPLDATTNPSLIFQAVQLPQYSSIVNETIKKVLENNKNKDQKFLVSESIDNLLIKFGCEILKIVPGRVSTEVDARLSYDTKGTVEKAVKLVKMYEKQGIKKERILVKIAATWEGIEAAKILESEHGIHCNITLIFSLIQAASAAEHANATLISPFVGRIQDWFKKFDPLKKGKDYYEKVCNDPGVNSVKTIYNYFKKFNYKTVVMGASFRNKNEIVGLSGIDYITISPKLLKQLGETKCDKLEQVLSVEKAKKSDVQKFEEINQKVFATELCLETMAYEKLGEGIRKFIADTLKLEKLISQKIKELKN